MCFLRTCVCLPDTRLCISITQSIICKVLSMLSWHLFVLQVQHKGTATGKLLEFLTCKTMQICKYSSTVWIYIFSSSLPPLWIAFVIILWKSVKCRNGVPLVKWSSPGVNSWVSVVAGNPSCHVELHLWILFFLIFRSVLHFFLWVGSNLFVQYAFSMSFVVNNHYSNCFCIF